MTGKRFKVILIILSCILASIILSIFLFAAIKGLSAKQIYRKLFPDSVEGVYSPYAAVDISLSPDVLSAGGGGYLYILNERLLAVYDDKGVEISSAIVSFEQPGISANDRYAVIYDRVSGSYKLFKDGHENNSGSLQRQIISGTVHDSGYMIFILQGIDGFLGSAALVSKDNETIALCDYSDRYPVSACMSGDGEKFAIAGIFSGDTGSTGIDIYELYNRVPVAGFTSSRLMPLAEAAGKNSFSTVGTGIIEMFDFSGEKLKSHEYGNILAAEESDIGIHLVDRDAMGDSIIFIGNDGEQKWIHRTGLRTDGIASGDGHLFYWSGMAISCLDIEGKPLEIGGGFGSIINTVCFGRERAAVLTQGRLIFYKFK
ncbi:MAG: hypothetical protein JXB33_07590 [Clostridia bacterium]|nr:hypothetical protein [Clostridia bacterium]